VGLVFQIPGLKFETDDVGWMTEAAWAGIWAWSVGDGLFGQAAILMGLPGRGSIRWAFAPGISLDLMRLSGPRGWAIMSPADPAWELEAGT